MTETLFVFDKRNYVDCQKAYRGEKNQEYYLGDYFIEAGSHIDVRADRKCLGSYSIICLKSRTRLGFTRSWTHIRDDATDVTVLWFVKRGSLAITQQNGHCVAGAGDFAITKSMSPFSIECLPDEDSRHEVLHVIVPSHAFRRYVPQELRAGFSIPDGSRELVIARNILTDVFEDSGELAQHIAKFLVESALSVVADAIKDRVDHSHSVRQTLAGVRLQDILRYIDLHLSDPNLSADTVAAACGISPRYMSLLLKQNGTPFAELVWGQRIKIAGRWIASSKPREHSISEIAFRLGFKSSAHFSRMFKRVYKKGPREYRAACQRSTQGESTAYSRQ